jgi:glycosyltransferase involved in cell wall biosynthesis
MSKTKQYNLVHITTDGEYKTPLVASQLFDQAEFQAVNKLGFAPQQVEAWTIGPMREYFDEASKKKITELQSRCPHIKVRMVNGIGRLKMFPAYPLLLSYRRRMGKLPVIYHCRGENAAIWAARLRQAFPSDKVVLDVRGYWPAEVIYKNGVEDPALAKGDDLAAFQSAKQFLEHTVSIVDSVTTVSTALRDLLIKDIGAPADTSVVPCCIAHITPDTRRSEIRKSWGVADDEIVLVYSGSTAAYQHLEDLTIPFLKKVMERNTKIRTAFLSSEVEKIKSMLVAADMYSDKVILKSFPQKEVGEALTACDAGILIRKPTLVNAVANPVKIAEYLGSGLPIIIEKNVGGVADVMLEQSILKGIGIAAPSASMDADADAVNAWLGEDLPGKRVLARAYAEKVYLWSAAINVSRKMYENALNNKR